MNAAVAFEDGISTVSHRAYGYSKVEDSDPQLSGQPRAAVLHWRRTDQSLTSAVLGDGGIYSSIDDLARWIGWLESGRFDLELVPGTRTDVPGEQYGFGWRISEHDGQRLVSHHGETIGFRNGIVRFPGRHLTVVVLTNRGDGDAYRIALRIADMFLKR